ncbi:unnamed protein product [Arctia plantaginis]|uniref:Cytochrome P450 n=1 Tax=Arctia plantaginis TaxID=874455 RepID=A0A8S0YTW0_ARCPL|nr:unnamed protein product [Arctia plantaginis]
MFSIVLCILLCFVFNFWWKRKCYDPHGPPIHPGALPIIGNAHQFLGDGLKLWKFLKELSYFSLKCGGVSTVYLGPLHRIYIVTDPDDCLTLSNACLDKPFIYDIVKEWANNGLITADVSIWKPHRKLLNPMFNQKILHENLEIFNSQARRLVEQMSVELEKGKFATHKYIVSNSQETVCQIILNLTSDTFDDVIKGYSKATQDLLDVFIAKSQKLWLHIPFIFKRSSYKKKLDRSIEITTAILNRVIQNQKAELKKSNFTVNANRAVTFLDLMLTVQETQGSFTDDDIREHLDQLAFTAFDTTTETLTFGLKLIGSNERVQQRIYEELKEVLGDTNADVSRYDLPQLVYLDAVVREILRTYSTVPFAARKILKDIKLKNYTLRANSIGAISVFGIHRHPIWGADVEEFRPERWLEPSLAFNDNPSLFAAFSLGKRNCIGKWYAMISIKTTLAHLLRHYRLYADDKKMTVKFDVSIRAIAGHEISLERR